MTAVRVNISNEWLAIIYFDVIVNYNTMSLRSRAAPRRFRKQQMNSRFDQLIKGLLSLAVILMFTAALIAGQANANLPVQAKATAEFGDPARTGIILNTEFLRKIESMPHLIDTILALLASIGFCIDELTPGSGDSGREVSPVR